MDKSVWKIFTKGTVAGYAKVLLVLPWRQRTTCPLVAVPLISSD
jgi:hypothetical protein